MKKILLIALCVNLLLSCKSTGQNKSAWTKAYEQRWSAQLNNDLKPRLTDEKERNDLVAFMIKRLKQELPQGIESVSADSANSLSVKIGKEYAYARINNPMKSMKPKMVPWTRNIERALYDVLVTDKEGDNTKENQLLCACVLTELKKTYPDSVLLPFPHDVLQKVSKTCFNKLSANK